MIRASQEPAGAWGAGYEGVGRDLLCHVSAAAVQADQRTAGLWTETTNLAARRLYGSSGMRSARERQVTDTSDGCTTNSRSIHSASGRVKPVARNLTCDSRATVSGQRDRRTLGSSGSKGSCRRTQRVGVAPAREHGVRLAQADRPLRVKEVQLSTRPTPSIKRSGAAAGQ
jgi:hypothetical protein